MNKIKILQVGTSDWQSEIELPENIDWFFLDSKNIAQSLTALKERYQSQINFNRPKIFDALLLTDTKIGESIFQLESLVESYSIFYPKAPQIISSPLQRFLNRKLAQKMEMTDKKKVVYTLSKILFPEQYGRKIPIYDLEISPDFKGVLNYQGKTGLTVEGNYGLKFRQFATFRTNIPYDSRRIFDIWQEFSKDSSCDLKIQVKLIDNSLEANVLKEWQLETGTVKKPLQIDARQNGYLSISLWTKGFGKMTIGTLHYRWGRAGYGDFILGGRRLIDDNQSEVAYYFNPQDFTPPLVVHFSDWSLKEGFADYRDIEALGCPFLLISDLRLDGGAFFIGSQKLESSIISIIKQSIAFLNIKSDDLIFSGLSMGAFAALFYSAEIQPKALVLGKPLVNIGTVAEKEKIDRPNVFPSSLDFLLQTCQTLDALSVQKMDAYLWERFDQADLSGTQIMVAYMKNDDYDPSAFSDIISHAKHRNIKVAGRGWIGRHDDEASKVSTWFMTQLQAILRDDFGRKEE
ncbi:accessory Sec system protein Asp2 [Streptococcus ratti]|uniref:Accessory Sec system protein Asp2 n=1 Tax=Streptococcus ratti TaxID=1341 RepID=A0A7X9QHI1_STRRT|nr:accessory Sec system protein Asp2 [Streptococcus ratti]NMD49572.1 accessory Sec system protein Asp2 [Streptococcus ratti]